MKKQDQIKKLEKQLADPGNPASKDHKIQNKIRKLEGEVTI